MNRIGVAVVAVGLIVLAIVGSVTGSAASRPAAPVLETAPVTTASLACPSLTSIAARTVATVFDAASSLPVPSSSSGIVTATVVSGTKTRSAVIKPDPSFPVASAPHTGVQRLFFTAAGTVAATLAADQVTEAPTGKIRGLSSVRCETPAVDWWFAGADGRVGFNDLLILSNPSSVAATATISMWDVHGSLPNSRLQDVKVPARSAVRLPIATIAPDAQTIALHVHATSGSVAAALYDQRVAGLYSVGADYLPATAAPSRDALVSGFMSGAGPRELIIANPGSLDATVGLTVISQSGSFIPAGKNDIVVKAGQTRKIDVRRALGALSGAIKLSSDEPVVAQGRSVMPAQGKQPDFMWLAATAALTGSAPIPTGREPDGGQALLLLTAPAGEAHIQITTPSGHRRAISVAAGHSAVTAVGSTVFHRTGPESFVVTPVGTAPVYVTRVLLFMGAHGALITSEPLVTLPAPLVLPPVRENLRVAVN